MEGGNNMSFLDAKSFVYNGVSSDSYNLLLCWMDDKPNITMNGLKRNIEVGSLNNVRLKTNTYGITYDGNIEFTFYIIKKDGSNFSKQESISLNNWLTDPTTPKLLYFNDYSIPSVHYYAVCIEIEDKFINDHNGKKIVFQTNSPFGFMEPISKKISVSGEHIFKIHNLADTITGIYYPTIHITSYSNNDIIVENISDHKSMTINLSEMELNLSEKKEIWIDSAKMQVIDKNKNLVPFWKLGWNDDYKSYVSSINDYIKKIYWLRLIRGINQIKVTGDCEITFTFEFPRKVGCL